MSTRKELTIVRDESYNFFVSVESCSDSCIHSFMQNHSFWVYQFFFLIDAIADFFGAMFWTLLSFLSVGNGVQGPYASRTDS